MESEYKWYIIKINYGCEQDICKLVGTVYFKDVFIPYQRVYNSKLDVENLCEVYLYMHLCDESRNVLSQISGFCSDDSGNFKIVLDDEINFKRKEFNRYKWYILRVTSNCEEKVRQHILENSMRLGINNYFKEVFIPYEELNEIELRSKKVAIRKKCFPGYIFLYIDLCNEVLNFIGNIPKSLRVYGFLKNGNVPKVILDDEIHSMCNALYSAKEIKKLNDSYEKGEKVKINDGLFQDFTGIVDTVNDKKEIVDVELLIFGKSTVVQFALNQVEKVED